MMRRRVIGVAFALMILVVIAAAAAGTAWLFHTQAGLAWITAQLSGYAGEGLTLEGASGTLAGGARVDSIRYVGEDIEVRVREARLALSPLSLLRLRPRFSGVFAREIAVVTKPGEPRGKPPDSLELPVNFEVTDAYVGTLVVALGHRPLEASDVRLSYAGGRSRHSVRNLTFSALEYAVALRGSIDAQAPFALDAAATAVRRDTPQAVVSARIGGNLSKVAIDASGRSGDGRLSATARLLPYDELPLHSIRAQASGLDLNALMSELPRTAIAADLALEREGNLLIGPLSVTNALPGPYDKNRLPLSTLAATVASDLDVVTFRALQAQLGAAGTITGSGTVEGESATLTLQTRELDLRGLHTRLRETQLAGRAELTLTGERQSVTANLAQDDLALSITAHRSGDLVEVPRFQARARGGLARGEARLSLAARRPFSIEAAFERFDPAAWGDFPRGSINGTVSAEGTLEAPAAEVRIAIRDSRWLDAPLAARGTVSVTAERLRHADITATLGGNRISAEGALGSPRDTLSVRFNAPRLGLIDPALQGTLRGTIELSGSWQAPRAGFDIAGAQLRYAKLGAVKSVDARGIVSLQPKGPIEADVRLSGIVTPQWDLRSARLQLEGTRGAHAAVLQASGERVDFRARARGAWRPDAGWAGTLLELENRGEIPVQLVRPVSLQISPKRVYAEPFEVRVVGGTLLVSELAYERGQLATAGRFSDLPVRPLVALAGAPAEMAGDLRLSGMWKLRNTPLLLGSITVTRDSGDVRIGGERKFTLGLQKLVVKADLRERGIAFDAEIVSRLATAQAQGRVLPVGTGDARAYSGASPLQFTATAEIARLAPLAAMIDTAMLIRGEARARLQGSGTLADPDITGVVTAQQLAVALPAEGIDLQGGTLRAVLTPKTIRVESFLIRGGEGVLTAQGTLARTGFDEASVDWRADRFTALARPDRRLVVSGKGNAALKGGKLSLTGNLAANEGRFELGGTTLPTLGDDVVVVGRSPAYEAAPEAASEAPRLKAIALDMRIALGNEVHVVGHGLSVWLSGDLRVYTGAQGRILASGTVNARNGTFVAYGQRLEIDRGLLYFNGPITEPSLDLVAMRKRQAVEAGVAITGNLRNPLVRVVSDPALPQGEALSWLLLGRAPGQASTGELSALPLAAGALLGKATGPLRERLKLDELSVGGGAGAGQFITLGKRITDRLYIVFEQGLGLAESLLRLEFTLTKRVVLSATAGEANSIGVYYRYRWD